MSLRAVRVTAKSYVAMLWKWYRSGSFLCHGVAALNRPAARMSNPAAHQSAGFRLYRTGDRAAPGRCRLRARRLPARRRSTSTRPSDCGSSPSPWPSFAIGPASGFQSSPPASDATAPSSAACARSRCGRQSWRAKFRQAPRFDRGLYGRMPCPLVVSGTIDGRFLRRRRRASAIARVISSAARHRQ